MTVGGGTLAERSRRVIPGGVNSGNRQAPGLDQVLVTRAQGARFWDQDERELVDFHCAGGPIVLGHTFADVDRASVARSATLDLVGVGRTSLEVELAEAIVDAVPSAEQVLLTMSGSEATYHALRLARAVTGRRKVVKFTGCYHGWHDSVALGFMPTPAQFVQAPMSAGSLTEVLAKTVVLPYNDIAAVRAAFDQHGPEIAAVIVEPIAHNVGAILPSEGFLATLRELCTRAGSVLVFDEVITGFRHALGGVQALWDVTPDLTTLGKAMANGYPIAALVGRADLMENFSTVRSGQVLFAGTYNGHPMSVAAAIETIAVLRDSDVYDRLFALGDAARTGLTNVFAELEIPVVVSGFGSVFVAYFMSEPVREYADLLRNDAEAFVAHRRGLFERGAFLFPANLKRAHLSYSHTDADVGFLIEQSREVLADMTFAKVAHR